MDRLTDDEWKELKIFLNERKIGRLAAAAREREWVKREGYKYFTDPNTVIGEKGKNKISDRIGQRMIDLFKGFKEKNARSK